MVPASRIPSSILKINAIYVIVFGYSTDIYNIGHEITSLSQDLPPSFQIGLKKWFFMLVKKLALGPNIPQN